MDYQYTDLGEQAAGALVTVALSGTEANIRLVDSHNFRKFKSGQAHRCVGGHYRTSPAQLTVPHAGRWYVVVDLGGYAGRVRTSVSVRPAA